MELIRAWVIRRFTFNLEIRLLMSLILSRIEKKNNLYCADNNLKHEYLLFTSHLTQINPILTSIRYQFVDSLVGIQNSHIGVTKVGNICW